MADEKHDDGLLNQEDIDAALQAAGLGEQTSGKDSADSEASSPAGRDAPRKHAGRKDAGTEKGASDGKQRVDSAGRPFDEVAAAMAEAVAAESSAGVGGRSKAAPAAPMDIPELEAPPDQNEEPQSIDLLRDVNLDVKIELGRSRMYVEDVLRLNEGSVVELDKLAGDPVDVLVNGRLVARGEILVLNDTFCVRINDIVSKLPSTEEVAV